MKSSVLLFEVFDLDLETRIYMWSSIILLDFSDWWIDPLGDDEFSNKIV